MYCRPGIVPRLLSTLTQQNSTSIRRVPPYSYTFEITSTIATVHWNQHEQLEDFSAPHVPDPLNYCQPYPHVSSPAFFGQLELGEMSTSQHFITFSIMLSIMPNASNLICRWRWSFHYRRKKTENHIHHIEIEFGRYDLKGAVEDYKSEFQDWKSCETVQ